ncbi:MAG: 16S rRNA (guanine(527)-N(7))-methyltransferase RsmG [Alcanivoracaceae bacterium]|jgi:16S rRNA (guanine527-N7)-methyltransferase|nr:16S rRNA (guanine(527)-N(7))-methyltransferase RsmG [Alcanivoracaceae bacterium]
MSERALLVQGLAALGLDLAPSQQDALLAYVGLLHKWNSAYNLTAVRDPRDMVARHLLDSLAIIEHLDHGDCLDVGTGPGIPGIPLAIARPEQAFTLLDSNGKKVRFVRQAVLELGLANVEVVQSRVEKYRNAFPQVVSRAFASLEDMLVMAGHLVAPGGRLLAMKATVSDSEQAGITAPWQARPIHLSVPQLNEPRQLVVLTRPA